MEFENTALFEKSNISESEFREFIDELSSLERVKDVSVYLIEETVNAIISKEQFKFSVFMLSEYGEYIDINYLSMHDTGVEVSLNVSDLFSGGKSGNDNAVDFKRKEETLFFLKSEMDIFPNVLCTETSIDVQENKFHLSVEVSGNLEMFNKFLEFTKWEEFEVKGIESLEGDKFEFMFEVVNGFSLDSIDIFRSIKRDAWEMTFLEEFAEIELPCGHRKLPGLQTVNDIDDKEKYSELVHICNTRFRRYNVEEENEFGLCISNTDHENSFYKPVFGYYCEECGLLFSVLEKQQLIFNMGRVFPRKKMSFESEVSGEHYTFSPIKLPYYRFSDERKDAMDNFFNEKGEWKSDHSHS